MVRKMTNNDINPHLEKIFAAEIPEIEKLSQSFDLITQMILKHSDHEIELLRALNDRENLIKEQIKNGSVKHIRSVFEHCYLLSTGRKAWDE